MSAWSTQRASGQPGFHDEILFQSKQIYFIFIMCIGCCVEAERGQKRSSDLLELQLEAAVSYPVWVLGTTLRSSARAERTLNDYSPHRALSQGMVPELNSCH